MSHVVIMPKLGLTMSQGLVSRWIKKEGDRVKAGEPLLDLETDKISNEIESPVDGYVLKILVQEGEERDVLSPLCIIGEKGEAVDLPKGKETSDTIKIISEPGTKISDVMIAVSEPGANSDERVRISPAARRLAEENKLDYSRIKGTGPDGRIVKEDIVSYGLKRAPLAGTRRIIAQRLAQSKHDIPHTYFKIRVDAGSIIDLKGRISEEVKMKAGKKPTLNDIIVKCTAAALEGFPDINVSLINGDIIYHRNINIGIAVNSEKGLTAPVIKNANKKTISEICRDSGELIERARNGKLLQEDITGGTFTISNLGAYHIDEFTAVINPPESAILAIGRASDTPCADNGAVVIKSIMYLTLSVDHRVIDGALAAQFLKKAKDILENPYCMLV